MEKIQAIFENYLDNIAKNPERLDSLLMWSVCTIVTWLMVWLFRKQFLPGLAGDGKHPGDTGPDNLDAREQIIFIFYFIAPSAIWFVLFFKKLEVYQFIAMWAALAPLYYQIFGKWIFDWILAFWNRKPMDKEEPTKSATAIDEK